MKYFQEMKARFQLPAAAFLPSLTLGLGVGILGPCSKCLLCIMVFQEFQDTGIFTQLCCVLPFSNLKLLIQRSQNGVPREEGIRLRTFFKAQEIEVLGAQLVCDENQEMEPTWACMLT